MCEMDKLAKHYRAVSKASEIANVFASVLESGTKK